MQNLNVINTLGWDTMEKVVNRICRMFAVSGFAGIQHVRVEP